MIDKNDLDEITLEAQARFQQLMTSIMQDITAPQYETALAKRFQEMPAPAKEQAQAQDPAAFKKVEQKYGRR